MTRLEALISLNMAGEIGGIRLGKLLQYFDRPQEILGASPEKLIAVAGISRQAAARIHSFKSDDLAKELETAERLGLKIVVLNDADYPENLKNIPSPPIVLYILGNLDEDDGLAVGIVGSRRASFYGLTCAENFAGELAGCGLTVISGMARGVDTYAHQGALKAGGRTIAVMGSGFSHLYPAENKDLARKISASGAVISEFPIKTPPLKENFPRRNRVISGLSLGILVVEAARNSGALITADFALEQGREVFALPGRLNEPASFGANKLIKQGAKLVTDKEDILEELRLPFSNGIAAARRKKRHSDGADEEEKRVYKLISDQPVLLDEILEKTNLNISYVYEILLRLRMKSLIRELPGKQFIKAL